MTLPNSIPTFVQVDESGNVLGGAANPVKYTINGTIADPVGTLNLGTVNATVINVGSASVVAALAGGATVAANKAVTGLGAMAMEATGALSLGVNASTTSIVMGQATVPVGCTGGITIPTGKTILGGGTLALEATGALTIAGAASTTSTLLGRAGNLCTMVGKTKLAQGLVLTVTTPADAAYGVLATDTYIAFPSAAAPRTITLPAGLAAGQVFFLTSVNANAQNLTIAITGGTARGTTVLNAAYQSVTIKCDGTDCWVS